MSSKVLKQRPVLPLRLNTKHSNSVMTCSGSLAYPGSNLFSAHYIFIPRFRWRTEQFPEELSIAPVKGSISPGMEVPLEVTFAPVKLRPDIRYEGLSCSVEGSSSSITLTVTGSCIAATTNKEVRLKNVILLWLIQLFLTRQSKIIWKKTNRRNFNGDIWFVCFGFIASDSRLKSRRENLCLLNFKSNQLYLRAEQVYQCVAQIKEQV